MVCHLIHTLELDCITLEHSVCTVNPSSCHLWNY